MFWFYIKVTESVLDIANNIAGVSDEELQAAQEETGATSQVVLALENQLAAVNVTGAEPVKIVRQNIAAEVLTTPQYV